MSDGWDKAGVIISAISAVLIVGTIYYAGTQVYDARRALESTTIYNLEKDNSQVFKPIPTDAFQKCFGKNTNEKSDINANRNCLDQTQRENLFDLLSHYRLMLDLQEYGALTKDYVDKRIHNACQLFANSGTIDTIADFKNKLDIDPRLISRINDVCGTQI